MRESTHILPHRCIVCGQGTTLVLNNVYDLRFGIDESHSVEICRSCGTEQLSPLPDRERLTALYNTFYNFTGADVSHYTKLRDRFLFSALYRWWLAIDGDVSFHAVRGSGRLLDIGCNEGRGLLFYRRNGYAAEGLELNTVAAAATRALGFPVHAGQIEDLDPSDPFDVVVLSNVLEHSLDPRAMLRHVHRALRTGGEVWISCPNSASWQRSLFGRYWINWHVPFHIVHFTTNSLQRLLRETGFEVVDSRQETPSVWCAYSALAGLFFRHGRPTRQLRNPLLVAGLMFCIRIFLFPLLWLGNSLGRGDCLVVRARRRTL